jgi:hypothetical protein
MGRSGLDLSLSDGKGVKRPILEQMATAEYIEPLKLFRHLIVYANVKGGKRGFWGVFDRFTQ